ncbi:MAG: hypothetical protein J0M24_27400 [Verrucomicrobia bacterium]|nr:hypothetical protein [Verrucomicrobiota bacterium]
MFLPPDTDLPDQGWIVGGWFTRAVGPHFSLRIIRVGRRLDNMKWVSRTVVLWFLLAASSLPAWALAGELKQPALAFPPDFPQALHQQIQTNLTRPEGVFVGGRFLNWTTQLNYNGSVAALNQLLAGLAQIPGARIQVRFSSADTAWQISHSAMEPLQFQININPEVPGFAWSELSLPAIAGPSQRVGESATPDGMRPGK